MKDITKEEQVWLEKYFNKSICALEKRFEEKFDTVDIRLRGLNEWKEYNVHKDNNFLTCKEHELFKDIMNVRFQNLEQSKAFLEGRASQTSVLIFGAISVIGFILALIDRFIK